MLQVPVLAALRGAGRGGRRSRGDAVQCRRVGAVEVGPLLFLRRRLVRGLAQRVGGLRVVGVRPYSGAASGYVQVRLGVQVEEEVPRRGFVRGAEAFGAQDDGIVAGVVPSVNAPSSPGLALTTSTT